MKKSNFSPAATLFASLFLQVVITYLTGSWLSAGAGLITTIQLKKSNTLSDRNAATAGMILSSSLQIAEFSLPAAMKVLGTLSGSFVGEKLQRNFNRFILILSIANSQLTKVICSASPNTAILL